MHWFDEVFEVFFTHIALVIKTALACVHYKIRENFDVNFSQSYDFNRK